MFPIRLKELRSKKGISQAILAKELNVSIGAVGNWESGTRSPDAKMMQRLADYFNTTTDYLLGRTDEVSPTPTGASSDENLMFALWGNDSKDITPEMIADVRKFAQFIRESKKDEANDNN